MADVLRIRNWDKWQTYRKDRGQPPWIKVHRCVMRDPNWVSLTDAQRGQLVALWLLAADRDGVIPASPRLLQKLCFLDSEPDVQMLMDKGFIEPDANMTSRRRQHDQPEAEAEESRDREEKTAELRSRSVSPNAGREWTGASVIDLWIRFGRGHGWPDPPRAEIAKQGAAGKRIAEKHDSQAVVAAMIGMDTIFPHSPPKGQPWDLFTLERKFVEAHAAAKNHPKLREAAVKRQFLEAS